MTTRKTDTRKAERSARCAGRAARRRGAACTPWLDAALHALHDEGCADAAVLATAWREGYEHAGAHEPARVAALAA